MSRAVHGQRLFGKVEKEVLRKQLWQIAEFCGVQILTYSILSNHFHLLVFVPQSTSVDDAGLLRRHAVLYPGKTRYELSQRASVRRQLEGGGPGAAACRRRLLALMGDISQFMKLLKQRFTRWFNQHHGLFGTLWAERFRSILVEPKDHAARSSAAYIDLNPVRAGLVVDPVDYRFCGYAEAVAGHLPAQQGLMAAMGIASWPEAQAGYRQVLFGLGSSPGESGAFLSTEALQKVLREGGTLPLASLLRCRARYFTDGAILGTLAFVQSHLPLYRTLTGLQRIAPRPLPHLAGAGELAVVKRLRAPILTQPASDLT